MAFAAYTQIVRTLCRPKRERAGGSIFNANPRDGVRLALKPPRPVNEPESVTTVWGNSVPPPLSRFKARLLRSRSDQALITSSSYLVGSISGGSRRCSDLPMMGAERPLVAGGLGIFNTLLC